MAAYKHTFSSEDTTVPQKKRILQKVIISILPDKEGNMEIEITNGTLAQYKVASETWNVVLSAMLVHV
jgi:hypothetical protein